MTEQVIDPANIQEYGLDLNLDQLLLDTDNPRLYAVRRDGRLPDIQIEIKADLLMKNHIPGLRRSILDQGLRDAIYVQYRPEFEKYVVIEGNTRAAIHMYIVENGVQSETMPDLQFNKIKAHLIKQHIGLSELSVMKVIWQTGKADWGKCERAMLMHEQHHDFGFTIQDIATNFQCGKGDVEKDLRALSLLNNYQETTGDNDTSKFSFFSKECPAKVRQWFGESSANKNDYFGFISEGRIPGVAIRGGLRDFAKFVEHPVILSEFKSNPDMTVEQGVERIIEEDLLASFKWMKNIEKYTNDLYSLANPTYQRMLQEDEDLQTKLRAFKRAISQVIDIIDSL